jgi:2-phosphosulfolactate phosphatase
MRKITVLTQKELIDKKKIEDCTAVVLDVFLATSTIVHLMECNYEPVYAVKDEMNAWQIAKSLKEPYILLGESNGELILGFDYPDPTTISREEKRKTAIICSTNGTKAIEIAKYAKNLFISSLVNGHRVSEVIHQQQDDSSIVIVCSGNGGRFSMEDFCGAGQLVYHFTKMGKYQLSDSALIAREIFLQAKQTKFINLSSGETGDLLKRTGFEHTMNWVIDNFEKMNAVPIYRDRKLLNVFNWRILE